MSWGFFNLVDKTFRLTPQGNSLKNLPAFCCRKSSQYPGRIPKSFQIFPSLSKLEDEIMIPIFSIINCNFQKVDNSKFPPKFHLACIPNTNKHPVVSGNEILISEYWRNIQPMILCQNRLGYYLGKYDDLNRVTFEYCDEKISEGHLRETIPSSESNDFEFGYGCHVSFQPTRIFIRRVPKFS